MHIASHEHTYDCINLFCVRRQNWRSCAANMSKRKRESVASMQTFPKCKPRPPQGDQASGKHGLDDAMADRDASTRKHFRACLHEVRY